MGRKGLVQSLFADPERGSDLCRVPQTAFPDSSAQLPRWGWEGEGTCIGGRLRERREEEKWGKQEILE